MLEKWLSKPSKSLKSWSLRGASPPGPASRALPCTHQGPPANISINGPQTEILDPPLY
ncbi:hypothetical protein DPMN_011836 [Dreissena polymorpha]|uniref:Uncharacterized protein n=1 Tax=Dreissena polymorpha TaxID=45954 RepID=A0A9D4N5V7_DREPO|nr:hypothetical protein DPMN_011836 [Dreissena polymorpha]